MMVEMVLIMAIQTMVMLVLPSYLWAMMPNNPMIVINLWIEAIEATTVVIAELLPNPPVLMPANRMPIQVNFAWKINSQNHPV